jgi:hypothetical protein
VSANRPAAGTRDYWRTLVALQDDDEADLVPVDTPTRKEIRRLAADGLEPYQIAAELGLDHGYVRAVLLGLL